MTGPCRRYPSYNSFHSTPSTFIPRRSWCRREWYVKFTLVAFDFWSIYLNKFICDPVLLRLFILDLGKLQLRLWESRGLAVGIVLVVIVTICLMEKLKGVDFRNGAELISLPRHVSLFFHLLVAPRLCIFATFLKYCPSIPSLILCL